MFHQFFFPSEFAVLLSEMQTQIVPYLKAMAYFLDHKQATQC
jgi:hypothetical protein